MKKYILLTVSLAISSNILFAYDEGPELGTMFSTGNAHYYVVRDFDTPEKNTAFTRNVEIMRRYANAIEAIKTKIATLPDGEEKTSLSNRLKQAEDEFANNDKVMQKLYAFSVARKYRQETFESNICLPITKEELSNLRDADGKELDPLLITERGGNSFYRIKNLKGIEENSKLQKLLSYTASKKAEVEKMRGELAGTTDPEKQLEISSKLAALEKAIQENDNQLRETFSIKKGSDYLVEIVRSKLYLLLNPDEVSKVAAEIEMRKSSGKK